ncbi:MAG: DAK2 domain-containing protein [Candidatus Izemoplasmatales bacterium]|nr:DAK2 domain-containing protein [Candidatus Izemoplasmatales bacterium]MDD4069676.1 DAK2 domain-containing protein [Candidatus Izemoplasmatales bacterium]MDY0140170.1 DAK2 domain-containing protein [Candidatus Izemoplasmatales bacterium]
MSTSKINGNLFRDLVINGSIKLRNNMNRINDLNVFPVPDGDTGSNMSATMSAGANAVRGLDEPSIGKVAKTLARGMLMGARGNSGVILSQLFSGIAKSLVDKDEVNLEEFSYALRGGVEQAYSAVIHPVEGTMLTVSREGADEAISIYEDVDDFEELFDLYLKELYQSLERTPDLLPVLKEVGVVDSGGAGFIEIVEGMRDALKGKLYEDKQESTGEYKVDLTNYTHADGESFGYCTEFIMQIEKMSEFSQSDFIDMISPLGDSLVVVQDENILKVHIHTQTPGDALNLAQHYGFFVNLKIENMSLQHTEVLIHQEADYQDNCNCGHDHSHSIAPKVKKKYAIVAVVNGKGLKETFIEMGCDYIIDGGQTMNPSVEDFIKAVEQINADHIIIIPNNKNVMLSAETARDMIEDKDVHVLKAKTVAQGYSALTMFDATQEIVSNIEEMTEYLTKVKTGEVTFAIRDSKNNGMEITKDDFMGILDGQIVITDPVRKTTVEKLISEMIDDNAEIITIMYGNDVFEEEIDSVVDFVRKEFGMEIDVINGGQEIYSYIISVE